MPVDPQVLGWFSGMNPAEADETSPRDPKYNCIAYAAGDLTAWWEPFKATGIFWPPTAPMQYTLPAYEAAFAHVGYAPCTSESLEDGIEKIAIFVDAAGTPSHAARQLPDGSWTSKLGMHWDIKHSLHQLEGADPAYGTVRSIMCRLRR